jgi:hypothetical protein
MCKKLIACLTILLCTIPAQAQQNNPCGGAGYVIAFFNGIDTTYGRAVFESFYLRGLYPDQYNNQPISYFSFYNPTDGFWKDLAESFAQKAQEAPQIQGRWELLWAIADGGSSDIIDLFLLENPTLAWVIDDLKSSFLDEEKHQAETLVSQANFQPIVNQFADTMTTFLTEQKKIMAVAHSQGNFFLNSTYDLVSPNLQTLSLETVQVATPTATVRTPVGAPTAYTTSTTDLVIQFVRAGLGSTEAPNVPGPVAPGEDPFWGHQFLGVYLNSTYNMFAPIKANMDYVLQTLQDPNTQGSAGLFTVTLTWSGLGDEDLHIFEPDGSHVFYANKQGTTGYLDVDNTFGFGPEHYYASCDPSLIQEGIYQVGINDYNSADGEIASIQLVTPQKVYSVVQMDTGPTRGSGGNDSPTPVFSVQVTKNSDGTYTVTK